MSEGHRIQLKETPPPCRLNLGKLEHHPLVTDDDPLNEVGLIHLSTL